MNCLSCYRPLKPGAKFCSHCGANQAELQAKEEARRIEKEMRAQQDREAMIKRVKPIAIGVVILAVLGCGGYFGYQKSLGENIALVKKPVLENTDATTKVQDWIKSLNLQYRSQDNCYVVQTQTQNGPINYCAKLTETLQTTEGSETFIYATLSSSMLGDNDALGGSHADSGLIDLLKFKVDNNTLKIVGTSGDIYSGSFGEPGTAKIMVLGANNQIGWSVIDGYAGMGEVSGYLRLYSSVSQGTNGIKEVLGLQTDFSNVDACADGDKTCAAKDITTVVRQTKTNEGLYPIKLSTKIKQGLKNNMSSWSQDFSLEFNNKKKIYTIPSNYEELFK